MIEAVVMLPVLLALLFGVTWLSTRHAAELQAAARARVCAWRIASSGCSTIPPECADQKIGNRASGNGTELSEARDRFESGNPLSGALLGMPVLHDAFAAVLPDDVEVDVASRLENPAVGGQAITIGSHLAVPCNEVPHTTNVLQDVLHAVTPTIF